MLNILSSLWDRGKEIFGFFKELNQKEEKIKKIEKENKKLKKENK